VLTIFSRLAYYVKWKDGGTMNKKLADCVALKGGISDVAQELGITYQYLWQLCHNKRLPDSGLVLKMVQTLEVGDEEALGYSFRRINASIVERVQ
jgi:transcriptional regulator with XRE-family HTH domain